MNKLRKSMVAAGLSAGLVGGGIAGVMIGTPILAGAQETTTTIADASSSTTSTTAERPTADKSTTTVAPEKDSDRAPENGAGPTSTPPPTPGDTAPTDETPPATQNGPDAARDNKTSREDHLRSTLAPLVEDGTLTQAQLDAVVESMLKATPPPRPLRRMVGRFIFGFKEAAAVIGISPQELGKLLKDGQSVADVAKSKNIDPQKVIDTMVASVKSRLDKAVADGRITQEAADERLTNSIERITKGVNGDLGALRPGRHRS